MIDWSKLEPYEQDNYRSFEELCYQIAKGSYGDLGRFTSIDDSGVFRRRLSRPPID